MAKKCRFCLELDTERHRQDCPEYAADPKNAKAEWQRGYGDGFQRLEVGGDKYYKEGCARGAWARDERDEMGLDDD